MKLCIFEKSNNSIATKLCAKLVNNRKTISARQNSMTKLCCALFKSENKLKIS